MSKIKNNKLTIIVGSLAVIVLIGIVYAAFTGQLTINGTANVRDSKWDIHIVESGDLEPSNTLSTSAKVLTKPVASATGISDFALSLTTPGDTIEYTFHVINDGDYDAEISTLTKNSPICTANGSTSDESAVKVCNKLTYTLKYDNGADVSEDDTILSKETKTMKLTVKYQEFNDPTLLPTSNVSISGLGITIAYSQKGNAKTMHTVTLIANGENNSSIGTFSNGENQITLSVLDGEVLGNLEQPCENGINYWYEQWKDYSTYYGVSKQITKDLTLYAYCEKSHNDDNYDSSIDDMQNPFNNFYGGF